MAIKKLEEKGEREREREREVERERDREGEKEKFGVRDHCIGQWL